MRHRDLDQVLDSIAEIGEVRFRLGDRVMSRYCKAIGVITEIVWGLTGQPNSIRVEWPKFLNMRDGWFSPFEFTHAP